MNPLSDVWIMIDAEGFTTCVGRYDKMSNSDVVYSMNEEVSRRPLHAPIKIYHWKLHGDQAFFEWRRANVFTWDGRTI